MRIIIMATLRQKHWNKGRQRFAVGAFNNISQKYLKQNEITTISPPQITTEVYQFFTFSGAIALYRILTKQIRKT